MKVKKWIKSNSVFLLVCAAILCMILLNVFGKYLGQNPFASSEPLFNPVQVCRGGDGRYYYITESSTRVSVTDQQQVLLYTIESGDAESSFETAMAAAADADGRVYIHDQTDSGDTALERILRFSSRGKLEQVLYETEADTACLKGLCVWSDSVYFVELTGTGAALYRTDGENEAQQCAVMPLENADSYVTDCAVSRDGAVSVCLKNGDVLTWQDEDWMRIYSAREHDSAQYFSLISEIAYGETGSLYLLDAGQREVHCAAPDGSLSTAIEQARFSQQETETFAEIPLISGLNAANGVLSVLAAEYTYEPETDEEIFFYHLAAVSEAGDDLFYTDTLSISFRQRVCTVLAYLAALSLAALLVYGAAKALLFLKGTDVPLSTKFQLVMVFTALAVTVGVASAIFSDSNGRFEDESSANLLNIGYRVTEAVDADTLAAMDTPDAFGSGAYERLDAQVRAIIESGVNGEKGLYCVIYKVRNDVVCEAYQSDENRGLMFPLAGSYAGGVEERIAAENSYNITCESLAEGTYLYALVPYYAPDGTPAAFVEVGMDYTSFSDGSHDLYVQALLLVVTGVIVIMLLFSELLCGGQAAKAVYTAGKEHRPCPPELIRPLSFLFFLVANISTAFLPIYGMQLWNERFPLQAELAAALPLTSEMVTAAAVSFLCGFLIRRAGVRLICAAGAGLYIAGNLFSAFAPNLWVLVGANAVCGAGSGCLTLALNAWAASYEDEEQQNKGFIHINAAYLAGLNCGTVIGSMIWERFGIQNTYFAAAFIALVLTVLCMGLIGKVKVTQETEEEGGSGRLSDLLSAQVIRYFVCISVPYLTCTAFLEYFFPIVAETNGLSAAHISMAFMLSGLISIYLGSSMAEPITERLGAQKAMLLASFLYAAALIYLVANPAVMSCYVVVVLFAVADSFGLSAQSVYFSSLPAVKKAGQSKALGVNSTVESVTSACGSLIFGAALMMGTQKGIFMIAAAFSALTVLFVLGERKKSRGRRPLAPRRL